MTIKDMQNAIIRNYGFEHPATVYFFERCEDTTDDPFLLELCYELAMTAKYWDEL